MNIRPISNSCVAQLIDANLDRAKEGLRVIEEWCRYGTNQKEFVITLKNWRQQLGVLHKDFYKEARCTTSDVGIGLTHHAQENRNTSEQVVAANFARVQEALRVLEEFARGIDTQLSQTASTIRYELYELEVNFLSKSEGEKRRKKLISTNLCLITSPQENLVEKVLSSLQLNKYGLSLPSKSILFITPFSTRSPFLI